MSQPTSALPPRNWPALAMFVITLWIALTIVPLYGAFYGFPFSDWVAFGILLVATEMSITCGYHRLFSHASYDASPALKAFFLLFGAMALQNSALNWCAGHRVHHRFIDDPERDPYCARRGFWFSHIGWMLRNYPSGDPDLQYVRELQRDPLIAFQHRYYLTLAVGINIAVPLILGSIFNNVVGMFLLAGVLRLVMSHHLTFCINSLAHIVGTRPYTTTNTARDNTVIAFLTFGEGYHNYHHTFSHDYRNGIRWWQWDPSKWMIAALNGTRLATNLRRAPEFKIRRALLETQFLYAQQQLARNPSWPGFDLLRRRVADEYDGFKHSVACWTALREQLVDARRSVVDRWETCGLPNNLTILENGMRAQYWRMRSIGAQLGRVNRKAAFSSV